MEWMIVPLKRYADFSGRSRRMEYWMFVLFQLLLLLAGIILLFAVAVMETAPGSGDSDDVPVAVTVGLILFVLGYLALLIPMFAVQARRFHDQDLSGWFVLLNFIPYLGGLIVLIFMCIDGTPGENRFGSDPKGRGHADIFA